jgi:hypothetical protein
MTARTGQGDRRAWIIQPVKEIRLARKYRTAGTE